MGKNIGRDETGSPLRPTEVLKPRLFAKGTISQLFGQAKKAATGKGLATESIQKRRRKGEDTSGGFVPAAVKVTKGAAMHTGVRANVILGASRQADSIENEISLARVRENDEGPMGTAELIAWYLANGYDMRVIRAMRPGLFDDTVGNGQTLGMADFYEPQLWEWNTLPDTNMGQDDFHCTTHFDFHLNL